MKWSENGFGVTQAEAIDWAAWFVRKNEMGDEVTALLIGFMASAEEWSKRPGQGEVRCPKCHGRGHSNLILLGDTKPGLCSNCEGTGRVKG